MIKYPKTCIHLQLVMNDLMSKYFPAQEKKE